MKNLKQMLVLCVLAVLSTSHAADGIEFRHISLDEAIIRAHNEKKSIFIDIYATWCGPCKILSRDVFVDKELGDIMNENFINIKLDGDKEDGEKLMRLFDLNSYPTMLILSSDMEVQKKIVGLVDSETIIEGANAVLHPENTEIFKLEKRYESGERSKEFLLELMNETVVEERDVEILLAEYLRLFPDLDLENEDEFLIFVLGPDDLEDSKVKQFLSESKHFSELHEEMSKLKITNIVMDVIATALEKEDETILDEKIKVFYPAYKTILKDEAYEEDKLLTIMKEIYSN